MLLPPTGQVQYLARSEPVMEVVTLLFHLWKKKSELAQSEYEGFASILSIVFFNACFRRKSTFLDMEYWK